MQKVVFDEPYSFVPPYRGRFWSWAIGRILPRLVRKRYGITGWTTHGLEHLRDSLDKGYGVMLCPNHSSLSDPMLCGIITTETPVHAFAMASWHVFKQGWLETFIARRVGGFSIYREGLDRKALDTAVGIVSTAERPLIIFPEGVISGSNDRLMPLMDGPSFVARTAAKKRARSHPDSKVVIHPMIFRYEHKSDPNISLIPILQRLERKFFWLTQDHLPLLARVEKLRDAIQSAREIQVLGHAKTGNVEHRMGHLVNQILQSYEQEWLGKLRTGDPITRVKDLRIAILNEMVNGTIDEAERKRRWKHLTDLYYAQCLSLHVPGYIDEEQAGSRLNHRLFETVARIEEELADEHTVIEDLHVDVRVGSAIEVDANTKRSRGEEPLMVELREKMLNLLGVSDQWPPETATDV